MNIEHIYWLVLSLSCLWLYFRILTLYDKVKHIYFLIGVADDRLDKLEGKEQEDEAT